MHVRTYMLSYMYIYINTYHIKICECAGTWVYLSLSLFLSLSFARARALSHALVLSSFSSLFRLSRVPSLFFPRSLSLSRPLPSIHPPTPLSPSSSPFPSLFPLTQERHPGGPVKRERMLEPAIYAASALSGLFCCSVMHLITVPVDVIKTRMQVSIHICTHFCAYIYIFTFCVFMYVHIYRFSYIYVCIHACMYVYIYVYEYTYICVYIYMWCWFL